MAKSAIFCRTAKCVNAIEKYGANYHSVHDQSGHALCERCGGKSSDQGETWTHSCKICQADVGPGELLGFFVPHRCKACDEKVVADERARGRVCGRCHQVLSYCCC